MTRHNEFRNLLIKDNINYIEYPCIYGVKYDFLVDKTVIHIALSALYNMRFVPMSIPIDKNYFVRNKEELENSGYKYFVIYDWEEFDKIIPMFKSKNKVRASACIIKNVDKGTTEDFLNTNHLQNTCKGQTVSLGLYYKDELVELMTFGKPRYNTNYEWELLRLCTKSSYIVYGGATKLFDFFVTHYHPKSIISYCNNSKFLGSVYKVLGFTKKSSSPSKHWVKLFPFKHITDNLLRQKGADALIGTNFGKNTSNEIIMKESGFLPVPDCGQDVYTMILTS